MDDARIKHPGDTSTITREKRRQAESSGKSGSRAVNRRLVALSEVKRIRLVLEIDGKPTRNAFAFFSTGAGLEGAHRCSNAPL
jgi:hypothetical protein